MLDYSKEYASSPSAIDVGLKAYMIRVYNYVGLALLVSGAAAFFTISTPFLRNLMFNTNCYGHIGLTGVGTMITIAPILVVLYFS